MSTRFVDIDRSTPMLLPPDMRLWVPEDDLVRFVGATADNHCPVPFTRLPPQLLIKAEREGRPVTVGNDHREWQQEA